MVDHSLPQSHVSDNEIVRNMNRCLETARSHNPVRPTLLTELNLKPYNMHFVLLSREEGSHANIHAKVCLRIFICLQELNLLLEQLQRRCAEVVE